MSKRRIGFFAGFAFLSVVGALGQAPPPNDNFSSAAVLAGTSITFTGTLAGATYEQAESTNSALSRRQAGARFGGVGRRRYPAR